MQHEITLATAVVMTGRYRNAQPENYPLCESFELASVQRLLATPQAAFLRLYYGLHEDGKMDAILVVADSEGHDILPPDMQGLAANETDPVILQDGYRCPPACPPASPLNP
jgi:hypothetical protein